MRSSVQQSNKDTTTKAATSNNPTGSSIKYAGRRRSIGDVGLLGGPIGGRDQVVSKLDDSSSAKMLNPVISVATIQGAPDVAYTDYSPPCDSNLSDRHHKPALMIALTNGTILCLDIEVCMVYIASNFYT